MALNNHTYRKDNHCRSWSLWIVVVMLMAGFAALISMPSGLSPFGTASASIDPARDTYVWDGEGADALASNPVNWYKLEADGTIINDVAPVSGSNLVWNSTSTDPCTFDLDASSFVAYSWNINEGYTGTITQAATADIAISGDYTQEAGTFTAADTKNVTCAGNFTTTGTAAVTANKLVLHMTGTTKTLSTSVYVIMQKLAVPEGSTITVAGAGLEIHQMENYGHIILSSTGIVYQWFGLATSSYTNLGLISGTQQYFMYFPNSATLDQTVAPGHITAPVKISVGAAIGGSRTLTLSGDADLGALIVNSLHASRTCTLDLAGHNLTATSIYIEDRGIVKGGEGSITVSGIWDSSTGTWTPESSNVILNGTVKMAAGQTFYDLTVPAGATGTQASNVNVTHGFWLQGTWSKGAYTLTLPDGYGNEIISTPSESVAEDAAYSYTPFANQGGTFSVTTDADWLTWDGTTLSGTPGRYDVGTYSVSILFENGLGQIYQNYTLEVEAHAISSTPVTVGHVGERYQYQVVSRYPALAYTITGPEWLTIDEHGLVTGTPPDGTVGRYSVTVTVETTNQTATQTYTLEVKGAPITAENMNDTLVPIAVGVLVLAVLLASMAAMLGKVNLLLPRRPRP